MTVALSDLLFALLGAGFMLSASKIVYAAFFSPLRHIPGPWYMAMSDFWLGTHLLRFQQTSTAHELFNKYGPVVRVGPNKVLFCDAAAMRSVYVQGKFPKNPELYGKLDIDGYDFSLTMADNASHSVRRRAIGSHYYSILSQFQSQMHQITQQLIKNLDALSGREPVDCLLLLKNYMIDMVVVSTFGFELGALQKWSVDAPELISDAVSDYPKSSLMKLLVPSLLWKALCLFPNARWRRFTQPVKILKQFVVARIAELPQIDDKKVSDASTLVERLLKHLDTPNSGLDMDNLVMETVAHFIAGTETSSITLSYLLWQLTCSPEVTEKLQRELDEAMPDPHVIPDIGVLQELPYLDACIQEGLRVHGAVTPLLERVVPPGSDFQLLGYSIPGGTVVATQAWSIHRDPRAFPSPERFDPERWLKNDPQCAAHFMPFGLGTRVCSGQPLAQTTLRLATAALVRNFILRADRTTTKESMTVWHGFSNFPASGQCKLVFSPRTS
ncbi:cytochrome P450 [Favolaschia claudopus]|uniref:Cytochrome P450 n=1 Tax=Favolaschia claudopus TaxID=2862362 RepID=A0AAW0EKH0_9AGAR